ncbi:MAG: hypothetical protein JSV88_22770 [Candidatus Aminicenantes bacterium]|nr:MAG: hypothetical protein JSV88_22770 [Candidatus Aminicenantes bacterium]
MLRKVAATHEAAGLARRRMKIIQSLTPFYCRGLIYQARSEQFIHASSGFDESNPYNRIYVYFSFV